MLRTEHYYRILDLQLGASPEEIHQGYLDLIWVWHPDRFVNHPRLQQKAHCKLQEINEAHERLSSVYPKPQRRDSRPKSQVQVSQPPHHPAPAQRLNKLHIAQPATDDYHRPAQTSKQRNTSNTRDVGEWLD